MVSLFYNINTTHIGDNFLLFNKKCSGPLWNDKKENKFNFYVQDRLDNCILYITLNFNKTYFNFRQDFYISFPNIRLFSNNKPFVIISLFLKKIFL